MRITSDEIQRSKERLDEQIADEFRSSQTWPEFCIRTSLKYGVRPGFFSKWHFGRISLEIGRTKIMFTAFILTLAFPWVMLAFSEAFGGFAAFSNPVRIAAIVLTACVCVSIMVAAEKWGSFLDKLAGIWPYA